MGLYPLPDKNEDMTKVWYLLNLDIEIWKNFVYDNKYEMTKLVHMPVAILLTFNIVHLLIGYSVQ